MPIILHLETATNICSVALSGNGKTLSIRDSSIRNSHSSVLTTLIEEVCTDAGAGIEDIDAVAVSEGPGSYTGLRIGVASAKGLCFSLDKPLIAIPTLKAMAVGMIDVRYETQVPSTEYRVPSTEYRIPSTEYRVLYCPMLDARRMEVYCGFYDINGDEVRETRAEIIDENSFAGLLEDNVILFAGEGATKCKNLLKKNINARFLDDFKASAEYMITLAEVAFSNQKFEDLAYFEPFYLKDFVAGKPRVKGLN
jgi:tRNA threonylcarbamoyladenosine biosynthesis protein TsaB